MTTHRSVTAASYGEVDVARVLVEAGAALGTVASLHRGAVPGGTALDHAAVFGMTAVLDVLVAAGARASRISIAAACGDIGGWVEEEPGDRVRALVMAARHGRLDVIDELLATGTPIDAVDDRYGGRALPAALARPVAVRHLLARGADPTIRDAAGETALDTCRRERVGHPDEPGYAEVEALLAPG